MFIFLLEILTSSFPKSKKTFGIPPIVKLSACLRFFAEGGYQKGVGNDHNVGLAQSTFSDVLTDVLNIFEDKLCSTWINMDMTPQEKRNTSIKFYEKYRIPSVIGCVDGTHIRIIAPKQNKHLFYNRKGFFSLNALLICDADMRIRFVDASRPGSSHDALIWKVSEVRSWLEQKYLNGEENSWLLGDAGYPLEPWLLTPHRNPEVGTSQSRFNMKHRQCRNIIERVNGVLKNRWRCLLGARELPYQPDKAVQIVNVCCALHNICIHFNADFDSMDLPRTRDEVNTDIEEPENPLNNSEYMNLAQTIRTQIGDSI
uniref:putative nuclease HARBI1 n=1 Tax=Episyrphus balteatus TaxID=286459 RepID=UPI0024861099|nr:putative nuclease HARBI1 [Episyrphus balteatus]